jgi:hypothetical protein
MTPSFLLLVPAVASAMGLPILDAPKAPDLATAVQQFASQFATETAAVLASVNSAVLDIVRVAYVTCLLVGVLLYFTHLGRRLGKDMMVGGVLLVVMGEYVIPAVTAFSK